MPDRVYEILDTDEGVERAFEKLDTIKQHIVWWEAGDSPTRLLATGEVAMSAVFNGRLYAAVEDLGHDFGVIWDGQGWDYDVWVIPKRTPRTASLDAAMEFIAFATDTRRLADQTRYISYGPARESSLALLDEAVVPHLPTAPANAEGALRIDAEWWARNQTRMERQFEHWLGSGEAFRLWHVR